MPVPIDQPIAALIPERSDQIEQRGTASPFDHEAYRERNVIERCVGWLTEARCIVTRYEKVAVHYLGALKLAPIQRYLRVALSNTPRGGRQAAYSRRIAVLSAVRSGCGSRPLSRRDWPLRA